MSVPKQIQSLILASRYLLVPMYIGLIVCMVLYDIAFFEDLWDGAKVFFLEAKVKEGLLLAVVGLVDITMIANLVIMITVGGYSIFVSEVKTEDMGEHPPRFLNNLTSGGLKIKMSASLISISGVHLLADFINADHVTWDNLSKRLAIHATFLISGLIFTWMEIALHPPHLEHGSTKLGA